MSAQIRIVSFEVRHLMNLHMRHLDAVTYNALNPDESALKVYEFNGNNRTMLVNDNPVGMGGIVPMWDHVAFGWIIATDEINKYKKTFFSTIVRHFVWLIKEFDLHRIEANVLPDNVRSIEMLKRMGFENEGLMRKYDELGKDYYRLAWVK